MSDVVNLRQFRKRKERAEKEQVAAENRIRYGRTGAEKKFEREKAREAAEFLDRNRLESPSSDGGA
ncbi:hypothetical protein GCM10011491_27290 [Brucella endophytica]|uniref:DUF4169 family protein n=1 Tax=Brucella endophytica TaxID=1963359 RepID=A0A916WH99_9HYPH|nr:DUF4169 family protein [Brucella endophytica]GGA97559.1 hypothetical protein GCM10011491_27290 [Brucella endophytica]